MCCYQVSRLSRVPQITNCIDSLDWLPEEGYCSRLNEAPTGSREYHREALRDLDCNSPFIRPPLKVDEIGLLVADDQRWRAGRGCDGLSSA
jgi:hypothetical protein